ncbi:bifunctional lysylphosphatidylglycerol synthetase/lysine--tRNA ligase LysX [Brevibacterium casei]|nr:bifunctional lysylphosphatidylglycerol synthetase/lysine--tRNA ligase LysX [Brevibacterium casei]
MTKLTGLGYTIRIRHQSEIPAAELEELAIFADEWRDGENERGFSMALGRFGDPADGGNLFVEALFPADAGTLAGTTAGLLGFVPWGASGVSLDVMRRHPFAENGVTEFMVAGLMREAGDLGIAAVSLNFAVFRSAFEQGKELGGGTAQAAVRNILLYLSRFWRLESLYRSNEKYDPEWVPRMLCYPEGSDLARIGLAVSIAEGFLSPPKMFTKGNESQPIYTREQAAPLLDIAPPEPAPTGRVRVSDQVRHRLGVRDAMLEAGVEPYPAEAAPAAAKGTVLTGRVLGIRDHGGVVFLDLRGEGHDHQLVCEREVLGEESLRRLSAWVSRGDRISVSGREGTSRNGTPSFLVTSWTMSAKSLRPWPSLWQGLSDPEAKVRQRYLDFTMNTGQRDLMVIRSNTFRTIRETLQSRGFLEVETPVLQTVHGGANARPFLTHINAYNLDLYLRIAPELYLKRLLVGGFDRVFEMGRNFRNEGVDATHNPEFSMLEAYQAGGDYNTMRELTRTMVINAAEAALGTTVVRGTVDGVEHEIDLAEEWRTVSLTDAISEKIGEEVSTATSIETLRRIAREPGSPSIRSGVGACSLQEIYEEVAEGSTVAPTFYTDFPAETSPLTRQHRTDPMLAEKWDLIIFGSELGTAYSELVDPVLQRERLTAQSLAAPAATPRRCGSTRTSSRPSNTGCRPPAAWAWASTGSSCRSPSRLSARRSPSRWPSPRATEPRPTTVARTAERRTETDAPDLRNPARGRGAHHLRLVGASLFLSPHPRPLSGYLSELAAMDQPASWVFRGGDAIAGTLMVLIAVLGVRGWRSRFGRATVPLAIAIGLTGLATIGDAIAALPCTQTFDPVCYAEYTANRARRLPPPHDRLDDRRARRPGEHGHRGHRPASSRQTGHTLRSRRRRRARRPPRHQPRLGDHRGRVALRSGLCAGDRRAHHRRVERAPGLPRRRRPRRGRQVPGEAERGERCRLSRSSRGGRAPSSTASPSTSARRPPRRGREGSRPLPQRLCARRRRLVARHRGDARPGRHRARPSGLRRHPVAGHAARPRRRARRDGAGDRGPFPGRHRRPFHGGVPGRGLRPARPERVAGIVLVDPSIEDYRFRGPAGRFSLATWMPVLGALVTREQIGEAASWLSHQGFLRQSGSGRALDPEAFKGSVHGSGHAQGRDRRMAELPRQAADLESARGRIEPVRARTSASLAPPLPSRSRSRILEAAFADLVRHEIRDSRHLMMIDRPDMIVEAVDEVS